jgi:hypothetical protein
LRRGWWRRVEAKETFEEIHDDIERRDVLSPQSQAKWLHQIFSCTFTYSEFFSASVFSADMSATDVKQTLKDAKIAIDSGQWSEVLTLTAQVLGLPNQNGSIELDPDAALAECLNFSKPIPKDLLGLYYQSLVFRGMACSNEAKSLEKGLQSENLSDKAKKDSILTIST